MSLVNETHAFSGNALRKMDLALQQVAASGKNKKEADFREAYPLIEQSIAKKVPFKVVLETFNAAYGYTLHPPRFRKMLLDERKRRAEADDVLHCSTCGQALSQHETDKEQSNEVEESDHV